MQAVVCTRYGPPEVLQLKEIATPVPRKNDVRIRILATAVTSSDCYVRGLRLSLAYRMMARIALGWNAPRRRVLGMVLSGVVDSIGADVRSFQPGDHGTPQVRREYLALLGEVATKGEIRPVIDRTYALDDIVDAHKYVDMGHK